MRFRKQQQQPPGIVGLQITHQHLLFNYLEYHNQQWQHRFSEDLSWDPTQDNASLLATIVKQKKLEHARTVLVLHPTQYHLLLIDQLNVAPEELAQATKWQIKDLVQYGVEDTAVDIFKIPAYGSNQQYNKMYVVASQLSFLQKQTDIICGAKLALEEITIPEIALRNIVCHVNQNQSTTTAILAVSKERSVIIICHENAIYLVRHIECDLSYDASKKFPNLWLELQRSFDYCSSQLSLNEPNDLVLISLLQGDTYIESLAQFCNERDPMRMVQTVKADNVFTMNEENNTALKKMSLASVGAAIELEEKQYEATH